MANNGVLAGCMENYLEIELHYCFHFGLFTRCASASIPNPRVYNRILLTSYAHVSLVYEDKNFSFFLFTFENVRVNDSSFEKKEQTMYLDFLAARF